MTVVLILVSFVTLCLGIFGWLWVCAGFRRAGWRGAAGTGALQISGLFLVYGILRGQPLAALFMAAFPPAGLVMGLEPLQFPGLLRVLAGAVALWTAAVLLLALAVRALRVWAPGLAVLTALVGSVVLGDRAVETAMCHTANQHGITSFNRFSFADSLTQNRDGLVASHALAETGKGWMAWSYRQMDWYDLPASVNGPSPADRATCDG